MYQDNHIQRNRVGRCARWKPTAYKRNSVAIYAEGEGSPPLGRGPGNKRFEPKWLHQFGHRISLTPAGETDLLPGGGLNTLVNNHTTAFCYSTHAKLTHLAKPTPPP